MPKSFLENWLLGPHDPSSRSWVGRLSFFIVNSSGWEALFLMYISFNAVVKLFDYRIQSEEMHEFLLQIGLYACIIFNTEWLIEILSFGVRDFFEDNWYRVDTVVNIMNWGSYLKAIGIIPATIGVVFPNIAFLRVLRFLKPLGKVRFLFNSKVIVKTVHESMKSMGPVLSLLVFVVMFFAIVGIALFGKKGQLLFRCGVPVEVEEGFSFYNRLTYSPSSHHEIHIKNCTINVSAFNEYRAGLVLHNATGLRRQDAEHSALSYPDDHVVPVDNSLGHLTYGGEWKHEFHNLQHGRNMTCIAVVPDKLCGCPVTEGEPLVEACIDETGACGENLCFLMDLTPISNMHGFSNFAQASLMVIAVFFQKNWSLFMDAAVEAEGLYGYLYFLILVIFGSFCLLNLTVATVGQTYKKVKGLAEAKREAKERLEAEKRKKEAERQAMAREGAGNKGGDEDDADQPIEKQFDESWVFKLWLAGILFPMLHRIHMKMWYTSGDGGKIFITRNLGAILFVLRCVTLNFFYLGWLIDGFRLDALNEAASEVEIERKQEKVLETIAGFDTELKRLEDLRNDTTIVTLATFLNYGYPDDLSFEYTIRYVQGLEKEYKAQAKLDHPVLFAGEEEEEEAKDDEQEAAKEKVRDFVKQQGGDDSDADSDDEEEQPQEQAASGSKGGQSYFAWFADLVVVINAGTLAADGFDDSLNVYLDGVGYFASIFFIAEAYVKTKVAGGFGYYLQELNGDGYRMGNIVDFTLVLLPTIGEVSTIVTGMILDIGEDYIYQMLALQALRVFRIAKLIKHFTGLKRLTTRAFGSPIAVVYAMTVTIIFIVFMALFGNELFKNNVHFAERRNDFQNFAEAMKAMLEFLFGESYFMNLEIGFEEASFIGTIYFIAFFYVANFLVLRMFIALIMENFEFTEDTRVSLQIQLFQKRQIDQNDLIDGEAKGTVDDLKEQWARLRKQLLDPDRLQNYTERWNKVVQDKAAEKGLSNVERPLWELIIENASQEGADAEQDLPNILVQILNWLKDHARASLRVILENRKFNLLVASAIVFSVFLLVWDTEESPKLDKSVRETINVSLLIFFTSEVLSKMFVYGVFTPVLPPRMGRPAFFSNSEEGGWNALDFAFICIMMVDVTPNGISLGNFKCIRIVRIVRPLQTQSTTVKNLVAALFASFGSIMHVLNLLILLMLIFGLLGVALFRGRLHSCNDGSVEGFVDCVGNNYGGLPALDCDFNDPKFPNGTVCQQNLGQFLEQPILVPRSWHPAQNNFENMGQASITLLRLLAADNLRPMFHSVMDIASRTELWCSGGGDGSNGCPPGENQYVVAQQPTADSKGENILFPIVYIFIANAFVSQLVIGVLIDNIRQQSGSALYTDHQRTWWATQKTCADFLKPKKAPSPPQAWGGRLMLYNFLQRDDYDQFMMFVIIVNTAWMATEHFPSGELYHSIKLYVDNLFVTIYFAELLAKMYSFGIFYYSIETIAPAGEPLAGDGLLGTLTDMLKGNKQLVLYSPFFRDAWNGFDFFVVVLSVLNSWILTDSEGPMAQVKLLRVLRAFRLVKKFKTLEIMVQTLAGATTAIISALFFLIIWIFVFATIMSDAAMFRRVKSGKVINDRWNFENPFSGMILLFRAATGDAWFDAIYDCAVQPPYCTLATEENGLEFSDCGHSVLSYLFFILFYLGCNYFFLPLFVATLIDYFFEAQVDEDSLFNRDECEKFANVWQEFDEIGIGYMSIGNLRSLIERLNANGSAVGFSTSGDMSKFKAIWARVIATPGSAVAVGIPLKKDVQQELGLKDPYINRENIVKAFGESARAVRIRNWLYEQRHLIRDRECDYKYTAKILIIYMRRQDFQIPLSSADLVNRGAAVNQFMKLGGTDLEFLKERPEYERWQAMEVHYDLARTVEKDKGHKGKKRYGVHNLSRILQAKDCLLVELDPPPVDGEKQPKPTGEKRYELSGQLEKLDEFFDEIVDDAVSKMNFGADELEENPGITVKEGVIDILFDKIIEKASFLYAKQAAAKIIYLHTEGRKAMMSIPQQKYTNRIRDVDDAATVVSSVPRGWLNSKSRPLRPRRMRKADLPQDHTQSAVTALQKFLPPRPPRADSRKAGPRPKNTDPNSIHMKLQNAIRDVNHRTTWKFLYGEVTPGPAPREPDETYSWKAHYERALVAMTEEREEWDSRPRDWVTEGQGAAANGILTERRSTGFFSNFLTLGGETLGLCSAPRKPAKVAFVEDQVGLSDSHPGQGMQEDEETPVGPPEGDDKS